jgi:hypothetical protein
VAYFQAIGTALEGTFSAPDAEKKPGPGKRPLFMKSRGPAAKMKKVTGNPNSNEFGTLFQKVFCHSAKSQTPLAGYFSSCKALKYSHLLCRKKVFCHSAKAQRKPQKQEW